MELGKFVVTLEFVKIVMNFIFVDKFLPYLPNFTFIIFFLCFSNSLHCYSNLHHTCLLLRSSLRFSKLSFKLMTFFQVKKLEVSCDIRQFCFWCFLSSRHFELLHHEPSIATSKF
jgi:hypothetical protein